jgi:Terminase large subunit, T4likevirus-type, N-terminal
MNLVTFPYQEVVHRSKARFRVVDGGRRIGKSVIGGREASAQLIIPESYVWVVGPTMDLAEKEFRVAWKILVDGGLIPIRRKSERELFIQFENGSFLECRSEENPDQLIGEGLDLVILAEAARLKLRTFDQYIRPALADRKGKLLATSTPRGFNWFYDFYERGQSDDPIFKDWESWMIPSAANPILGEEEIAAAKATSSPEAFAQEWEAKFIAYGGLVFPEFSYETHVRALSFTGGLRTALWIDPGITAPYAVMLVQITPDEQVFVLDEIYVTGCTADRVIDLAQRKWSDFIYDKNGRLRLDDVIIDKAAAEAAATWRLRGFNAGGEKPKIEQGIEVYHMFLRDPINSQEPVVTPSGEIVRGEMIVPRIFFDPKCKNAIKEHGLYHYPDETRKRIVTNPTTKPVDVDNHAMDAIRYGLRNTFPQLFNEGQDSESIIYLSPEELGVEFDSILIEGAEY